MFHGLLKAMLESEGVIIFGVVSLREKRLCAYEISVEELCVLREASEMPSTR
jgi:hypothetical protein